jgi:hypothetical protein
VVISPSLDARQVCKGKRLAFGTGRDTQHEHKARKLSGVKSRFNFKRRHLVALHREASVRRGASLREQGPWGKGGG